MESDNSSIRHFLSDVVVNEQAKKPASESTTAPMDVLAVPAPAKAEMPAAPLYVPAKVETPAPVPAPAPAVPVEKPASAADRRPPRQ